MLSVGCRGNIKQMKRVVGSEKVWRWVVLLVGSTSISLWVLFRFFTKSINFDLVGQQLLARQWLEGNFEGSIIGPTNYIVKMLFMYMPAEFLGVDPKLFLIVSSVVVNIITFVGIYFALKWLLQYFSIKTRIIFNISMLWIASVAGSVFWVQFTNSRNLEVLAGLVLLCMGLALYRSWSWPLATVFFILAGLTYFSDPLQLFVTSMILVSYVILETLMSKNNKQKEASFIVLLVVAGYLLSRLLLYAVQELTGVEFIQINTLAQSLVVMDNIPTVIVETIKNMLRLVAGTNEMGVWRQIVNLILVGLLAILATISIMKSKLYVRSRSLAVFTALMLVVPVAVYVASGQAVFKDDTSRYLIMLAPALVVFFSLGDKMDIPGRTQATGVAIMALLLLASIGALAYATVGEKMSGNKLLSTDVLKSRYEYLQSNGYLYGYASMDTAIPAMYVLGGGGVEVLLPLSCENKGKTLKKRMLFYDKNIFMKNEKQDVSVPIILDGSSIKNYPNACTVESIKLQLGEPELVDDSHGNIILIYNSSNLKKLRF